MSEKQGTQKPAEHKQPEHKPAESSRKGKHEPLPGGCFSRGCKTAAKRFDFCEEHYDHFKFGLIKRTGEQVSDYEKKFEHFVAWKERQRVARKVA
ncbi:MAG: hypothetical protein H7222_11050 [Methylotenera sp.]|nr:hypothetical protein [Oligoflexia bacterium]